MINCRLIWIWQSRRVSACHEKTVATNSAFRCVRSASTSIIVNVEDDYSYRMHISFDREAWSCVISISTDDSSSSSNKFSSFSESSFFDFLMSSMIKESSSVRNFCEFDCSATVIELISGNVTSEYTQLFLR